MVRNLRKLLAILMVPLLAISLLTACGGGEETPEAIVTPSPEPITTTEPSPVPTVDLIPDVTGDPNQPPKNPFLADSPWATNHGNSYRQDSSTYAGPTKPPTGEIEDFLLGRPATTNLELVTVV